MRMLTKINQETEKIEGNSKQKKVAKKERVPDYVLQEIEKGLEDVKNGNVIESELVHKQMKDYVQNCLDN